MNVADIQPGRSIDAVFLVSTCDVRETRTGNAYLRLTLRDRTGDTTDAVWFGVTEADVAAVRVGEPYEVMGRGDSYNNRVNVKITAMRPSDETWEAGAHLPQSQQNVDGLIGALRDAVESIAAADVRAVLRAVIADPLVKERLPTWPAAKTRHHAWIGGLAEHTVEMLRIAERVAEVFPQLDRDLLIAGVVLHDLGKIEEIEVGADFAYTPSGNLEGHMVQGVHVLDRALATAGCEGETAMLLRHLVLSHQGQLDFSAVVEPQTPEAIALHFIDQLSSQVRPAIEDTAAAARRGVRGVFVRGPTAMRQLYVRGNASADPTARPSTPADTRRSAGSGPASLLI